MILVEIIDKGKKVANNFRPVVHEHLKQWLEDFGEKKQGQFIVDLLHLQELLSRVKR